ncbi:FHA domain-containing protein [Gordonia aurantiaca]|uniref:FHA domain-containing protein n=1 Tax=Gordonia sp. B21 TaxID=3151852 RepID=UPI003264C7D1
MTGPGDIPSVTPTVTLVPGAGIVIRKPAFLAVVADSVPAAFVTDLLDIESAVAVPDSAPRRGRHLVRALARLVATADEPIDIGFAAPDNVGIAVFLSGGIYGETDGHRIEPGVDAPYDKAIPWPYEGLGLYLDGTVPAEVGEERFDLVDGVVPAAGALLHTPLGMRGTEFHPLPEAVRKAARPVREPVVPETGSVASGSVTSEPEPVPAPDPGPSTAPPSEQFTGDEHDAAGADVTLEPMEEMPVDEKPPVPVPAEPGPGETTERMRPDPALTPEPEVTPEPDPVGGPLPFTSTPLGGDPGGGPVGTPVAHHPLPPVTPAGGPSKAPPGTPDPFAEPLEPRPPLPREQHSKPVTEVVRVEASRAKVHGIRCARGHLNHPQSWICGVCGIRMDQLTTFLVEGERPPLGWLLLDNGFTFLLDEDLVIGREPGASGGGRSSGPRPIRVKDETGQLSRRHVEIRLVEWTVQLVDLGSANGTFVTDPSTSREIRLLPHRPHVLVPGSHVRIGGRHFIFESHHARI